MEGLLKHEMEVDKKYAPRRERGRLQMPKTVSLNHEMSADQLQKQNVRQEQNFCQAALIAKGNREFCKFSEYCLKCSQPAAL